jgi:hypothetical protein
MRHLALFVVLLLASCANPAVISNPPSGFTITEFAPDGSRRAVHQTSQYSESGFPPTVQFRDVRGNPIRIRGSYLIEQQ